MKLRHFVGLAPLALMLAASAAVAQPGPHPMDGAHAMAGPNHEGMGAEMKARHDAMMKQHLEDLKTILRLRPDQEAALQALVAAHEPPQMGMMKHPDEAGGPPMTTPERLDAMAKREAEMSARHEKMIQAVKAFYAQLTPDQQKVFDALHRLQGHGMGRMGGMMGDHDMMGGHHMMLMMRGDGPPPPPPGEE